MQDSNPQPVQEPVVVPDNDNKPDRPFDSRRMARIVARQDPEVIRETIGLIATFAPDEVFQQEKNMTEPTPTIQTPPAPAPTPTPEPKPTPVETKTDPKAAELEAKVHAMEIKTAKLEAISEFPGLTRDDIDLIAGNTPDEVRTNAKRLSDRYAAIKPADTQPASQPTPGAPEPVVTTTPAPPKFPNDTPIPDKPTGAPDYSKMDRKALLESATEEGRRILATTPREDIAARFGG